MKINIKFPYVQEFLPSKRHKKVRKKEVFATTTIDIEEVASSDFPVAFVVHSPASVYENATKLSDFEDDKKWKGYIIYPREIRVYNETLYTGIHISSGAAISTAYENKEYIEKAITSFSRFFTPIYNSSNEEIRKESILIKDDKEERISKIKKIAKDYIVCDNIVYKKTGEPRYVICTFGLGNNHGGTGFFIETSYNPNLPKKNYFNALQYNDAVEYGQKVAYERGDTDSISIIGKMGEEKIIIDVKLPEMVKIPFTRNYIERYRLGREQ